eukprot:scaffold542_cov202-Alexandrium_tamarense.AAC.12
MLSTQPEFITGIDDVTSARSNAFGAMGMFLATFALSIFGMSRSGSSDSKEDIEGDEAGYQLGSVSGEQYGTSRYD